MNVEVAQISEQPQHEQFGSSSQSTLHNLVNSVASKFAMNLARTRKEKDLLDAHAACKMHAA
jgi:hypothetical protein